MELERAIDLYVNADISAGQRLFTTATSANPLAAWQATAGDRFILRVHWRLRAQAQSAPTVPAKLPAGAQMVIGVKPANALGGDLLAFVEEFTEVEDDGVFHYEAIANFNTSEILAAFNGQSSLRCQADLEIQNADNTKRLTHRLPLNIFQQAYSGLEGEPVDGDPPYPPPGQVVVKNPENGAYRIKETEDGVFLQFWNPVTEKYHTLYPNGPEEALTTAWGPGED